ncbi:MAG: FAD-dependent oxidoreductase [Pseudomonadota bacterium]
MRPIVFGRWGSALEDGRKALEPGQITRKGHIPSFSGLPDNITAIMSGKGFLLYEGEFDFVRMIKEYVARIQEKYCCGKCLTGIKGTKMLLVTLEKIVGGSGENSDLGLLERVGGILNDSAKCSVCQSAGELTLDGLTHFRDHFERALAEGVKEPALHYMSAISAPCMTTCPCRINIPAYVEKLQEVRYEESLEIIREEMPVPGVTGRVCPAPCEKACTLANHGCKPIPIRILKRVAADYEMTHKLPPPMQKRELREPPVAVVGAGPAGLSAAYYLNRRGHPVTIFEAMNLSGGMVRVGIPPYRQPRRVLERDIRIILELGVKLEEGKRLGKHFTIQGLYDKGFKAVFLGIGSHRSLPMGIKGEGENIKGVFTGGIDFLRDLNLEKTVDLGSRVIVVGGGNTAVDCARTSLRMGAQEVRVVYRRTEHEMPADHMEVEDAADEGVIFHFLTQPVEIIAKGGQMRGLRCIRMELGEPDKSGRRRPVPVEGSEFDMEGDTIIPAIGQKADLDCIGPDDGIAITRWGTIKVDPDTMMTSRAGVFAAGDAVSGPLTVVHAVAGGKPAADMIHEYLKTGACTPPLHLMMDKVLDAVERDYSVPVTPRQEAREGDKAPIKKLDRRERIASFEEVESGLSQYGSFLESSRCLRCFHLVMAAVRP